MKETAVVETLTPMAMVEKAVASGADIEVLERLMGLQERWQANQARQAFTAALSALRDEMPAIVKTRTVDFTTQKGRTHYRYEDLSEVVKVLSPVLAKHGLSFRWRTDSTQAGHVSVTCILEHADGHNEETTLSGPYDASGNKNAIQAIGSVTTYLQRYTLKASLGIAAALDGDGEEPIPTPVATKKQADLIEKLLRSSVFTDTYREEVKAFMENADAQGIANLIDTLKEATAKAKTQKLKEEVGAAGEKFASVHDVADIQKALQSFRVDPAALAQYAASKLGLEDWPTELPKDKVADVMQWIKEQTPPKE